MTNIVSDEKPKQHRLLPILIPILMISLAFLIYILIPKSSPPPSKLSFGDISIEEDTFSEVIVIYGDGRTNHEMHQQIVNEILELEPQMVFHTGDLVEDGNSSTQWEIFNEITFELMENTEFYPALGNHERNSDLYYDNFELPNNEQWYSVDYYGIHFVVLDSNVDTSTTSEQYGWLQSDLEAVENQKDFIVLIFHHPPFTVGKHSEAEELRTTIVPLFEEYNVDLAFSGHDHNYQRNLYNGIYYIVTGGGGAPLYGQATTKSYNQKFLASYNFCTLEIVDDDMLVKAYDESSNLIDEITIEGQE